MKLEELKIPNNWRVFAETDEVGRTAIHLQQDQPDSHRPGERWVYGEYFWVGNMTDEQVLERIYTTMQFLIIHELSENFKYLGVAVFDQHRHVPSIAYIHDRIVNERVLL